MSIPEKLRAILPDTAGVTGDGHLTIGGCDVVALADQFGTPLYVFDEVTLRQRCAEYQKEFRERYADTLVLYACKAFINRALALILKEEGLGLDIVSGGELSIAKSVAFPPERAYFHGNNKSPDEIKLALQWGIGRIVVDNFYELSLLDSLSREADRAQDILLRLCPGIDVHTHRYTTTGILDSKFGFPLASGQAEQALVQAMSAPRLKLIGLHVHLGSLISEVEPYQKAVKVVLSFAREMKDKHGFHLLELDAGGGFAIPYTTDIPVPTTADFAQVITSILLAGSKELGLEPPRLIIEPGRAIGGQAGMALYRAGATKDIPGVRKYISVDGGIADNIRPALYGSRYEALVGNKMDGAELERVTIAGKFCESGDILIKDIDLPRVVAGDIIAIPVSGAYCLSMASNYNAALKPAIVLVKEGKARLIRRRESYEDLILHDVI